MQTPAKASSYLAVFSETPSPARSQAILSPHKSTNCVPTSTSLTRYKTIFLKSAEARDLYTLRLTPIVSALRKRDAVAVSQCFSSWARLVLSARTSLVAKSTWESALVLGRGCEMLLRSLRLAQLGVGWRSWTAAITGVVTRREEEHAQQLVRQRERQELQDRQSKHATRVTRGVDLLCRHLGNILRKVDSGRSQLFLSFRCWRQMVAVCRVRNEKEEMRQQVLDYEQLMTALSVDMEAKWGVTGSTLLNLTAFRQRRREYGDGAEHSDVIAGKGNHPALVSGRAAELQRRDKHAPLSTTPTPTPSAGRRKKDTIEGSQGVHVYSSGIPVEVMRRAGEKAHEEWSIWT